MKLADLLSRRSVLVALLLAVVLAGVVLSFFWRGVPQPGSKRHEEFAEAFWVGTAALDSGITTVPEEMLTRALAIYPDEPAALANRGLAYMRTGGQLDLAARDLERAASLAPDNADIKELVVLLRERQNRMADAIAAQREVVKADPDSPRRIYKLNDLLNKEATDEADDERLTLLSRIVELRPTNYPALVDALTLAARKGRREEAGRLLGRLEKLAPGWKPETRGAFAQVQALGAEKPLPAEFRLAVGMFGNHLRGEPGYLRGALELKPETEGWPLQAFVKVPNVRTEAAAPDVGLAYPFTDVRYSEEVQRQRWDVSLPAWLGAREAASYWVANAKEVRRAGDAGQTFAFPSGPKEAPPTPAGIAFADLDNDYLTDLVLAGAGGLRFWKRLPDGGWKNVTTLTRLPEAILSGDYFGVWAVDFDSDADLDLILAPRDGPAVVLRNNMDGTFTVLRPFDGLKSPRAFVWADLDNDGASEACFLDDAGSLHVYANLRGGQFKRRAAPKGEFLALAAGDIRDGGRFELLLLDGKGGLHFADDGDKTGRDHLASLAAPLEGRPGEVALFVADMDNNGAFDFVARSKARSAILLNDGKGRFTEIKGAKRDDGGSEVLPGGTAPPTDLDGDGWLDLIGLSAGSRLPTLALGKGTKDYRWLQLRLLANTQADAQGDKRINSFNIGGEAGVRTGRLALHQPVTQPVSHFGLGTNGRAHLTRIVWANGTVQWEFERSASGYFFAEQRLKGSCPFLFSWDGEKVVFVADFCWSTPLGMYINGQDKGGFLQTTDWIKIRRGQLRARDGLYDLRVNANLWETHFLDEMGLIAVDHPAGTECHVDERFFLVPTEPRVYLTEKSRPVAKAWDHKGADVTHIVRDMDGKYLDRAGRGTWQGVTNDHWVEIDLGDDAPKTGPVYLLATGFVHPTDSSVNFALTQSSLPRPQPLSLEVPDGKGGWRVGSPALGFPAGKNKTVVLRLDGIEAPGKVSRRVRLRTSMEIYWDRIAWARGLDASSVTQTRIPFKTAELSYRGILDMTQADASSPELPHYDRLQHTGQKWRDLAGYHTRFGDVAELLRAADDRYVIMNAGDEIRLTFPELPVPAGKERTFIWVSDGWVKDGDLNTKWGGTVLPLPYHGMKGYDTPPGRLVDDPVFIRFPKDWETYHTRLVSPEAFKRGLRPARGGGR